jgi:hypothetical protein
VKICSTFMVVILAALLLYLRVNYRRESKYYPADTSVSYFPLGRFPTMSWRYFKPILIKPTTNGRKPSTHSSRRFNNWISFVSGLLLLCGDVSSHPGPAVSADILNHKTDNSTAIKSLVLNARSLKSHHRLTKGSQAGGLKTCISFNTLYMPRMLM